MAHFFHFIDGLAAFYDSEIGELPEGAVPIEESEYRAALEAQSAGATIIAGADGKPTANYPPAPTPEDELAAWREALTCSRAQAIAVLGEERWSVIEAVGDDPETPWTQRAFIKHAETWQRTSPTLNALAPLLDLSDQDIDDLFVAARATKI